MNKMCHTSNWHACFIIGIVGLCTLGLPQMVSAYVISGTVKTETGAAVPGVLMTLSGNTSSAVKATNTSGKYQFTVVDGTYSIAANKSDYYFKPIKKSLTVAGSNKTEQNFIATPTTQIKCLKFNMSDGDSGTATFKFIRISDKIYSITYVGEKNALYGTAVEKDNKLFISFADTGWFSTNSVYTDMTHGEIDLTTKKGTIRMIDFDAWPSGGENQEYKSGTISIVTCP